MSDICKTRYLRFVTTLYHQRHHFCRLMRFEISMSLGEDKIEHQRNFRWLTDTNECQSSCFLWCHARLICRVCASREQKLLTFQLGSIMTWHHVKWRIWIIFVVWEFSNCNAWRGRHLSLKRLPTPNLIELYSQFLSALSCAKITQTAEVISLTAWRSSRRHWQPENVEFSGIN